MTFNQFIRKYREGTLDDDAAWRAYDFKASVKDRHVKKALKAIGLAYAGELAVPHFMALYSMPLEGMSRVEAETALGAWWLWSQVDAGRAVVGLVRRPGKPEAGQELGV